MLCKNCLIERTDNLKEFREKQRVDWSQLDTDFYHLCIVWPMFSTHCSVLRDNQIVSRNDRNPFFLFFLVLWKLVYQRWSPRGRPWPRGHILKSLASKPQVLGLGLEASIPWPWPRSLKSSKIALSSARGQHCFLNS